MSSGSNSLTAQDTDAAGNTGTSNAVIFTLPSFSVQWIGPSSGSWNTAANWSTGVLPGPLDELVALLPVLCDRFRGLGSDGLLAFDPAAMSVFAGVERFAYRA